MSDLQLALELLLIIITSFASGFFAGKAVYKNYKK